MGLRSEAEALIILARQQYPDPETTDGEADVAARWHALDRLCKINRPAWLALVCKYTPALPQLLAVACEVDQGQGPTTGLVMGQFLDLAQSVTWEEIEQGELTTCPNG